jgi:hypothetical protein
MNSQSRGIRGGREASPDDLDGFVESTDAAIAGKQPKNSVTLRDLIERKEEGS